MLLYWRTTTVVNELFAFVVALFGDDRALAGSNRCANALTARSLRPETSHANFAFPARNWQTGLPSLSLFCLCERSTHVQLPPKNCSNIAQKGREVETTRQRLSGTTHSPLSGNSGRPGRPFGQQ